MTWTPQKIIVWCVLGGLGLFFSLMAIAVNTPDLKKEQANLLARAVAASDPVRFAKTLVPGAEVTFESERNPQTGMIDRLAALEVKFSIDPVPSSNALARDRFFRRAVEIVPAIFNHFDKIEVVEVKGTAGMVDIRGHESIEEVASLTFARSYSLDINWPKVQPENVPLIANKHYLHPRLVSDLDALDPVRSTSKKDISRSERSRAREPN